MSTTDELPAGVLADNWRPLSEERTLTDLEVIGELPGELDGRYLRNGSNPISGSSAHPFIGEGMIHGIRLRDGRAEWYRNRYVSTPFTTPGGPELNSEESLGDMTASMANTSIVAHAGRIMALEEGHFPYVLDGMLDTVGPTDFDGRLTGPFTAHPKICPVTGELLAFGYSMMPPFMTYLRVSASGELVQAEEITVGGATMVHDFNVTEHHVIFMDLPAVFDLELAMQGELPIRWDDDYTARLGVMPRTGTDADVEWYDIDPCYVFHPMNAYEDGDRIVVDVARLPYVWRDGALDFPDPALHRWTIDRAAGRVAEEQVDDLAAEFPRVPDDRVGLRHRYGYMMANAHADAYADRMNHHGRLAKYDRETGARSLIDVGRGRLPGEASFVPREHATAEDDGYLMTYVHDAATDSSEFVVYDAATMSDEPIARVPLPRVPFGFHGNWVPVDVAD